MSAIGHPFREHLRTTLGTFAGEIDRWGTALKTAARKFRLGMRPADRAARPVRGAFDPHPFISISAAGSTGPFGEQ